ncbi:MAG TPA: right-handed parallel beta-helix repeat-containing protein [Lentimicrobium sp.]|nr:right-handed parallel beta-helix repeat-containing protein [Lentimicrobium sp.]
MKLVQYYFTQMLKNTTARSLLTLIIILQGTLLYSATYYIDPTYTGSNQNGSQSKPFNSWSKVNISSGNTYLQRGGTTAQSGQIAFTGKSNITFGAYGNGSKPKIITSGSGNGVFYITNSSNITIKDLEITSSGNWNAGIIIQGSSSSGSLIRNCWIHHMAWGIRILTSASGTKILNSKIHDILDDGIFVQDSPNIEIGYCTIFDINRKYLVNTSESYAAGDGIQLNSTNNLNFNIHHNTIDHSSMGNKFCFYVWGNNYTGVLEYNTFIGNIPKQSNGAFFNNTTKTVTVRYNTFKNGYYGFITYASKVEAYYNRFITNKVGILVNPGYTTICRNNVFYNNSKYGISSSYNTNVTLRNNIFHLASSPAKAFYFMGSISSNNNIFNTQYSGFINGYASLNAWKNSTGNDMNSVVGNPYFVNAPNGDFHIQSASVAINHGQNVNLNRDYFGNYVPQNGIPDAGIHEYPVTKSAEISEVDTNALITDSALIKTIRIFPNPSSDGNFSIQFIDGYQDATMDIYDVSGNKLKEGYFIKPETELIDLTGFPSGIYLIKINTKECSQILKAIIN